MSRRKKTHLLHALRDRELNTRVEPYKLSLNMVNQLIRSKETSYKLNYSERSPKPVSYEYGRFYFNNYTSIHTLYGSECKPSKSHNLKPENAKKKVIDVITYTTPVNKTFDNCKCINRSCSCVSGFILCLTDDGWLCQYNLKTGTLIKEVYVQRFEYNFKFKYCDWDEYASRVVLTTRLNCDETHSSKAEVVVNMALFTVFPLEFYALFEIKRSVFGKPCMQCNVDDQLLILGMGYDRVHIYSFLDVLAQGDLSPYKLGDKYNGFGEIGKYPTGLPLNYTIETPPPLLFNIVCFGQTVCFGGFPYHCIYPKPKNQLKFIIQSLKGGVSEECHIESNVWNDEPCVTVFHPDNSNRIILRELLRVCVYDIKYTNDKLELKEAYRMEFQDTEAAKACPQHSSFGRRINRNNKMAWSFLSDRTIMATAYEDELNIYAIMGVHMNDPQQTGYINMYDSVNGEELKSIKLSQSLTDTHYYKLEIDREMVVIIEKDSKNLFNVFAYQLSNI